MRLDDVPSEPLSQLLASIRASSESTPFPTSKLGLIPAGSVLSITGPSGSFKTRLVQDILVSCVMPTALGGWGKSAVVFNMDLTFDVTMFSEMLATQVPDVAEHREALSRLHIFKPKSTAQLAVSIAGLPRYHREKVGSTIALVVVDSMSAFHWPDRYSGNTAALNHVLLALQAFRESHRPITVLTNWGLVLDASKAAPPSYKQHLPVYPTFPPSELMTLTHDIVLSLQPVVGLDGNSLVDSEVTGYIRTSGNSEVVTFRAEV